MGFFILVFIVHTLVNAYLFIKGWKALPSGKIIKTVYCFLYFIVYGSFIIAMLGRNALPLSVQKPLYMIGTGWLAVMLYATLYFLLTDLLYLINKYRSFLPASWTKKPRWNKIQTQSACLLVFLLLSYGYFQFTHPTIVEQDIYITKNGNNRKELKAVGISDLHLGITVGKARLKKYVEQINALNPDIILIAGDMIDNNLYPLIKEKMWEELNNLKAPLGVYMCLGNHEYLSGIEQSLDFLDRTSLNVLIDRSVRIDDSFYLIGRNDLLAKKRSSLQALTDSLDQSMPIILLDHEPFHLEEAEENKIDFQFSGHTHNGQLFPLNFIVSRIFELPHGYKQKGNTHYYVSSGLGLWGPQFRIGTQSEILVFNIKFN